MLSANLGYSDICRTMRGNTVTGILRRKNEKSWKIDLKKTFINLSIKSFHQICKKMFNSHKDTKTTFIYTIFFGNKYHFQYNSKLSSIQFFLVTKCDFQMGINNNNNSKLKNILKNIFPRKINFHVMNKRKNTTFKWKNVNKKIASAPEL